MTLGKTSTEFFFWGGERHTDFTWNNLQFFLFFAHDDFA